nr:PREDICTED: basic proline-rich protein-like [Apteryx mantelli mantelli]XP_013817083.1 PREDICTED: basic proline-rich protein-like [Apteryx mantelli mantelli]
MGTGGGRQRRREGQTGAVPHRPRGIGGGPSASEPREGRTAAGGPSPVLGPVAQSAGQANSGTRAATGTRRAGARRRRQRGAVARRRPGGGPAPLSECHAGPKPLFLAVGWRSPPALPRRARRLARTRATSRRRAPAPPACTPAPVARTAPPAPPPSSARPTGPSPPPAPAPSP